MAKLDLTELQGVQEVFSYDYDFPLEKIYLFQKRLYVSFTLAFVSNFYSCYMILFKSTKEMKTYKWFLLNITVKIFKSVKLIYQKLIIFSFGHSSLTLS